MTEKSNDELWRSLGGIEKSQELILRTLSENRTADATYRTDIRRELGGLRDDVQEVRSDVRSVTETVTELRPKVITQEEALLMDRGASRLWDTAGKVAHVFSMLFGGFLLYLFQRWLGK
jgi:hypothetical protein